MRKLAPSMAVLAVTLAPALVAAYQGGEVAGGGRVRGTVMLREGPYRKPPPVTWPKDLDPADRKFCGAKEPLVPPFYEVEGGRLRDVVVWLEGVKQGKPLAKELRVLANRDCRFHPHVQTAEVGAELQVENHDPILHNTHPLYLGDKSTLFNIALPAQGQVTKKKVRRPGVIQVQCDAGHVWMRAFVHAFDHPYHAVTGKDGAFDLGDVPPGRYTLRAWHEAAGTLSQAIVVPASGEATADIAFDPK